MRNLPMHRVLLVGGWCVFLSAALIGCRPVEDPGSAHLDVDAGDDLTIEEGESVTLSASVGGRTKGFGFRWEYQAGPAPMDADEEDLDSPKLELGPFVVLGQYKFRVIASTADGRFGQDFIVVIVEPESGDDNTNGDQNDNVDENDNGDQNDNGNENDNGNDNTDDNQNDNADDNANDNSPEVDPEDVTVRANAPSRTAVGLTMPLVAGWAPGGLEATYRWAVLSGEASITNPDAARTDILATATGEVTVRLRVDLPELGEQYTDTVTITVDPKGTFVASATGAPAVGPAGEPVRLTALQYNADVPVGGRIVYAWEVVEGEGRFVDPRNAGADFTPTSVGEVVVRVTALTQPGDQTATDDFVLLVYPNPIIVLEATVENLVRVGEPTELTVTPINFDEDQITLAWRVVSGDATLEGSSQASPTVTLNSLGTAEFELTAEAVIDDMPRSGGLTVYATAVQDLHPQVNIVVQDVGQIPIQLNGEAAPITVANLLHYIDDRGYDGLVFGRVIPGFIVQVVALQVEDGEYAETGPPRDCIPNEAGHGLSNVRGTVSLALISGDPDSGARQFFVNLSDDNTALDEQNFTVFGEVIGDGMVVVDAIATVETGEADRPIEPVVITSIRRMDEN